MRGNRQYKGILTVLLAAGLFGTVSFANEEQRVSEGVTLEGIALGGMTEAEVRGVIADLTSKSGQTEITVMVEEQSSSGTLAEFGLACANTEIVDQIMNLGATGSIVQRYKDQKDLQQQNVNFTLSYEVDSAKIAAWAEGLTEYNSEPVNATIYTTDELRPGVSGGTNGITVNVEETAATIEAAAAAWNNSTDRSSTVSVEAVLESVAPDVTYDDLAIISDQLGSATTDYSASSYARAINVENGCSKITGTLIYPGESFSVTSALVPFTAENGYEQAPSYEENRVVDSYGGGICQVSTTLYNAVLKAELEIIERSNHTMVVSYVPLSKDAAIAEGVMDLQFYNNLSDPVYIIGWCYGGQITFTVYGHETRPSNRTLEFESVTTNTIEPSSAMIYANTSQAVGYINQTQSPHTGYSAELWKHVYVDGVLTESIQVNSSYYTAVGTIYDVGVATENTALSQAMYAAVATNDITQVQAVISSAASYQQQTETQAADTSAGTDTYSQDTAAQAAEDAEEAAAVAADDATIVLIN